MSNVEAELREEIAHDQRLANISGAGIASDAAVRRRRLQVGGVAATTACGLLIATFVAERVIDLRTSRWLDLSVTRIALVCLTALVALYCYDQERHLKRVEAHRSRLFQLDGEIASNLLTAGLVLDAVTALHAALELDQLLPTIVEQGRALVGADRGVLFLYEERGPMQPVVDSDDLAPAAATMVEQVSARNQVIGLVEGTAVNIGVPVGDAITVHAVLVLPGVAGGELNADTVALLTRFGHAAGAALGNARRYEAAMFLLDVAH